MKLQFLQRQDAINLLQLVRGRADLDLLLDWLDRLATIGGVNDVCKRRLRLYGGFVRRGGRRRGVGRLEADDDWEAAVRRRVSKLLLAVLRYVERRLRAILLVEALFSSLGRPRAGGAL